MTRRAVLYLRLSVADDASTSISRQEADLRALAEREGWEVVGVLTDEGVSGRRSRANAETALSMLRNNEADTLAVWKLDRWTRQGLSAVGALVSALDEAPGALFVALQDGLRSDQAAWRIIASVLAEVARMEAENTAARVRSSIRTLKHSGRWSGGVPPLGYRSAPAPDGPGRVLVVDDHEAAVLTRYAERAAAGESLSRLARDLTVEGFPQARSPWRKAVARGDDPAGLDRGTWPVTTLRQVLTSETLVGRVTHHGETLRGDDGRPLTVWPPAIDPALFARVRTALPSGPARGPQRRRAARLLSGVLFCGGCGRKMYTGEDSRGAPRYKCPSRIAGADCSVSTVAAIPAERAVEDQYLAIVGNMAEVVQVASAVDETASAIAEVDAELRELSALMLDEDVDTAALVVLIDALKARRTELRARPESRRVEWVGTGRSLREAWIADDDVDERRRLLLSVLDHVDVLPMGADDRGRRFSPERLRFHWNDVEEDYDTI